MNKKPTFVIHEKIAPVGPKPPEPPSALEPVVIPTPDPEPLPLVPVVSEVAHVEEPVPVTIPTEEAEAKAKASVEERLSSQAWRICNLYWVEDENGKKVKFKPRWEQKELHNNWHNQNTVLKCRQPGISTYCALEALDFALFCTHKTCGVIDKTDDDAKRKLDKIRFAYNHLDDPDDPETAGIGAMIKAAIPLTVDNVKELEWLNGSKIWAGTSMRGGTLQLLWITELGHTSFYSPEAAEEIRKGALNTVSKGNTIIIESTHEGGKFGVFYSMVKLAMESRDPLSAMDWKFHFFPWWRCKAYYLDPDQWFKLTPDDALYFKSLVERGIQLSPGQQYWYVKKRASIGDNAMMKEFPSVEEECFEAIISGAIYGKAITALRANKRIVDFEHDRTAPLFAFWDIGFSDFMSIWLLQFVSRDILALAYRCNCRESPPYYAAIIRGWEQRYQRPVLMNYLPHDAKKKELTGKSMEDYLHDAGIDRTQIVTRTPDIWQGVNRLRSLLPRFYFHKTECGREWVHDGQPMPSGIGCLEGYHTKEEASSGLIREMPVHDANSHGADGLRTFSEAEMAGLITGTSDTATESMAYQKPQVILAGWNQPRTAWSGGPRRAITI